MTAKTDFIMTELHELANEAEMVAFGAEFVRSLKAGNIVLLSGPLGAGKTTLARAMLRALGWNDAVRSPTYNLIHTYPTSPPVMHADLYRLESAAGVGLEEFFDSHVCLIEWPNRLKGALKGRSGVIEINIALAGEGRTLTISHGLEA